MKRGSFALLAWLVTLGLVGTLFIPGCSENGQTGNCPNLTRYDINAAGERNSPQVQAERDQSVAAGCMTPLADASVEENP